MRRNFIVVLAAIAACTLTALLPAVVSAQGNSAVDQYVEQVPSAGGNKPADKPGGDQGGRPGSGSGGSGSSGSGSGSDGSSGSGSGSSGSGSGEGGEKGKNGKRGDKSNTAGKVAADGDETIASSDAAAELARANVPAAADTNDGGGFPLLALLILTAIAVASAAGYWRFARNRGSSGTPTDA